MKVKKENSKGEFQHRMFKLIILIIVFIFCGLIAGFIYITLTSSISPKSLKVKDPNYNTEESIIKSNEKYRKMINNLDFYTFTAIKKNNNTDKFNCDINNFYKNYISNHFPCVYRYNVTDKIYILNNIKNKKDLTHLSTREIGTIDFIDKYMKLLFIEFYHKNNNNNEFFKNPRLDNVARVIINNSVQKVHIYLSPISQIEYFNWYQNKSTSDIVNFYLKNNIDDKIRDNSGEKDIIYYEFDLDEADLIYIPSYYFIQIKEPVDNLIIYEYQDISYFNDMFFKILYSF